MKRPQIWLFAALLASLAVTPSAVADDGVIRPHEGGSINEDVSPVPLATRRRTDRVWVDIDPGTVSQVVNSNQIYLNNCKPNGCVIRGGQGASSIDSGTFQGSWPINGNRTLTAFAASDQTWNQIVDCMKDVFSPFGVEIVTTNPSPAPHFEIMIAGRPTDIGLNSSTLGVSPFSCSTYIPNSLVFAFQKAISELPYNEVEEICATAAQEIAHSFALDHVIDSSDPLTYFPFSGRRYFKNAQVQCGSDCYGGTSPTGLECTGGTQQIHPCVCTGSPTQNSVQTITNLFGAGTPTPPTVKITSPKLGDNVAPGFPVHVEASDNLELGRVELYVDNMMTASLQSGPFAFNAPATLSDGTHLVKVIAYDSFGTSASAQVQVVIGEPCGKPADCPSDTDTCVGGRCVPGPGVQGGLGATCNAPTDCASGQCASNSDGERQCVESCLVGEDQCPDGFGCLNAGDLGVCWKGYDDGSGGGGCTTGGPMGLITMGLGLAVALFRRRRR
ncbi:MAG: Ig-like domain-containing protein [Kofleriaceae bacterium]